MIQILMSKIKKILFVHSILEVESKKSFSQNFSKIFSVMSCNNGDLRLRGGVVEFLCISLLVYDIHSECHKLKWYTDILKNRLSHEKMILQFLR